MRTSYIATTSEASALQSGEQTAIIVKMKVQPQEGWSITKSIEHKCGNFFVERKGTLYTVPYIKSPYTLNEPVYVREAWCHCDTEEGNLGFAYKDDKYAKKFIGWQSPITMPRSAARTWFKPVRCEVVRVQSILSNSELLYPLTCGIDGIDCGQILYKHAVSKLGQQAWDNNDCVFYYKIERI